MAKQRTSLSAHFHPETYHLTIDTSDDLKTFQGTVTIVGKKMGRPSHRIVLYQRGLKIIRASLLRIDKTGRTEIPIDRINTHNLYDEARLHSSHMLYPGNYELSVEFLGKAFPSTLKKISRLKSVSDITTMVVTENARDVLPCIDRL